MSSNTRCHAIAKSTKAQCTRQGHQLGATGNYYCHNHGPKDEQAEAQAPPPRGETSATASTDRAIRRPEFLDELSKAKNSLAKEILDCQLGEREVQAITEYLGIPNPANSPENAIAQTMPAFRMTDSMKASLWQQFSARRMLKDSCKKKDVIIMTREMKQDKDRFTHDTVDINYLDITPNVEGRHGCWMYVQNGGSATRFVTPHQAAIDRKNLYNKFKAAPKKKRKCVFNAGESVQNVPKVLMYNQGDATSCSLVGTLNMLLATGAATKNKKPLLKTKMARPLYGIKEESDIFMTVNYPDENLLEGQDGTWNRSLFMHEVAPWNDDDLKTVNKKKRQTLKNSKFKFSSDLPIDVHDDESSEVMQHALTMNCESTEGLFTEMRKWMMMTDQIEQPAHEPQLQMFEDGDMGGVTSLWMIPTALEALSYIDNADDIEFVEVESSSRVNMVDTSWWRNEKITEKVLNWQLVTAEIDALIVTCIDHDRAVCVDSGGHTRAVIGYNETHFLIQDNYGFLSSSDETTNKWLPVGTRNTPSERFHYAQEPVQNYKGGIVEVRRPLLAAMAKSLLWVKHENIKQRHKHITVAADFKDPEAWTDAQFVCPLFAKFRKMVTKHNADVGLSDEFKAEAKRKNLTPQEYLDRLKDRHLPYTKPTAAGLEKAQRGLNARVGAVTKA